MKKLLLLAYILACSYTCAWAYTITALHLTKKQGLSSNIVGEMMQDRQGYIWMCSGYGLNRFDGYQVKTYTKAKNLIPQYLTGLRERRDVLYISTSSGWTCRLDLRADTFLTPIREKGRRSDASLIYRDKDVTWRRLGSGRVQRSTQTSVRTWQLIPKDILQTTRNDHFHAGRLPNGLEIITTYGNGFFVFDPHTGQLAHFTKDSPERLIGTDYLTHMLIDRSGCVWIAKDYLGVACLRFNDLQYKRIMLSQDRAIEKNNVRAVCVVGPHEALVADNDASIYKLNLDNLSVKAVRRFPHKVYAIMKDHRGQIWTGTRGSGVFVNGKPLKAVKAMNIYQIVEDARRHVWIGTLGDGLIECTPWRGSYRLRQHGKGSDYERLSIDGHGRMVRGNLSQGVMAVETDRYGQTWMSTDDGIVRLGREEQRMSVALHPLGDVFNPNASAKTNDGRLLFGSHEGLIIINPSKEILLPAKASVPAITSHTGESLTLPYDQSTVRLTFSNFDYANTGTTTYSYRLEGLEDKWSTPNADNMVTYHHLAPGKYTFHVRANGKETSFPITVLHPWWNTPLAWGVYVTLILAVVLIVWYYVHRMLALHQKLSTERQMAQFKNDFYGKVLREIRSPLNVVQGTSTSIGHSDNKKTAIQNLRRSSRRLVRLFEMIEEFRNADALRHSIQRESDSADRKFEAIKIEIAREEPEIREMAPRPANNMTVMVVTQDHESAIYLDGLLSPYFKVRTGEALPDVAQIAAENYAAIIVDTGNRMDQVQQWTAMVRKELSQPIVHITQDHAASVQLKSLKSGASECVVKPFDGELLLTKIIQWVEAYARTTEAVTTDGAAVAPTAAPEVLSPESRHFLDKMQSIVATHIHESDFNVSLLGDILHLGRTQLNKKVKDATGLTPIAYIKEARLERVAELLCQTNDTVETICSRCGIVLSNRFYRDFRTRFGCSPSEYRNR